MLCGKHAIQPFLDSISRYIIFRYETPPRSTKAYPGFAVYHEGPNLVAVVSTGEEVWHLSVTGIIMNRTWVNIGITWNKPNLEDSTLPVERLGGLEMYINQEKVGSTLLPEFTDDSKQVVDLAEL